MIAAHRELLTNAAELLEGRPGQPPSSPGELSVGVDLGTATMVVSVLDPQSAQPLALRLMHASVVRDGLVVDFVGAVDRLKGMIAEINQELGVTLARAASGFPPGVPPAEVQAVAHVLGSAGLECTRLIDEPSAANLVLGIQDGAIVDVGGGTTGVAVIQAGKVVFSTDQATGGTHFDLVISGGMGISYEGARSLKEDPAQQERLFGMVRPVMEKVAAIVNRAIEGFSVPEIHLVGGAASFQRFEEVVQEFTGIPTKRTPETQLVTPLGIALAAGLPLGVTAAELSMERTS